MAEGGTLAIAAKGVLANDFDPENDLLTAVLVANPHHGTVTLNSNGSFTYKHDGSETTRDSFTYKVNDGKADSNTATVTITVTPVNDPPVAKNDGYLATNGKTLIVGVSAGVLVNDTDAEGQALTAVLVSKPSNGTLTLNPNGSFLYNHDGGTTTSDSFTYRAGDGAANSNTATVTIKVFLTLLQQATLAASDAGDGDDFGISVAIDKDTLVVGAGARTRKTSLMPGLPTYLPGQEPYGASRPS